MDTFVIASWTDWPYVGTLIALAKAGLGLGFVIFVHELGHFLAAKACGVKCEKFYVGFDVPIKLGPITLPRAFFRKRWGETEYGIGVIPLGGYVKMLGQDDNPANAAQEAERIRIARQQAEQTGGEPAYALDPRSYPAKSVPKRMLIISAGVIMNIIFAVIFATAAYYWGVEYTPAVVGQLQPGQPAWESNLLQPGDKILQLGRNGKPSEYLRFDHDLAQYVAMSNGDPLEMLVRRGNSEPRWVTLQAREAGEGALRHFQLGIHPATSAKIPQKNATQLGGPAHEHAEALDGGGTIVALEVDGVRHRVSGYSGLAQLLAQHADRPVTYWIERPNQSSERAGTVGASSSDSDGTTTVQVTVDPNRRQVLGIDFQVGPIVSIRKDSPADRAGLRAGEVIRSVNGVPVDGVLNLPYQLASLAGQSVELELANDASDEATVRTVTVTPVTPDGPNSSSLSDNRVPVLALGLVVESQVTKYRPVLSAVDEKAASAGLRVGDTLKSFQFRLPEAEGSQSSGGDSESKTGGGSESKTGGDSESKTLVDYRLDGEVHAFSDRIGVEVLESWLQFAPPEAVVDVVYERAGKSETATLPIRVAEDQYLSVRGILLENEFAIRRATSFSEAVALGGRETWESLTKVFVFLRKLVTGEISLTSVGGPLTIGIVATSHASSGIPRLLIILTLISANLAVLNFLPIPVLDGGHMMFLLYEGIFGKPMNDRMAFLLTMVGFSFILMLMALAFGMDIYRIVEIVR